MKAFIPIIVALFATAHCAPKTDDPNYTACNETNITWGVDYTGSSSKFDFYECANKQHKLTTTISELAEYDGSKRLNTNKVVSFAGGSQDWNWETQEYSNYTDYKNDSVKAVCNKYTSNLSFHGNGASNVPVPFNFTSCILLENYEYEDCPEETPENPNPECITYTIEESSLKWSVVIGNFPFSDDSHTLKLTVQIQQSDAGSTFSEDTSDNNFYKATIGDFNFVAPLSGENVDLEGTTSNVNVGVDCDNQGNNKVNCVFTFAQYNGTMYYDPTIGSESNNGGSSDGNNIFSLLNICCVVSFVIINVVLF